MTEPTAEQIEAERERAAHAVACQFFGCPQGVKCDNVATALARVRIEAHAAGRDEAFNEAANVADCHDGDNGVGGAIRALRGRG